jgi:hypothetical protein
VQIIVHQHEQQASFWLFFALEKFLNYEDKEYAHFKAFEFIATYCMYQRTYVLVVFCRQTVERVTLQSQLQQLLEAQKSEGRSLPSSPR